MALGRPRAFDIDKALDRALKVFWKRATRGHLWRSLTRAMGINRPSLYAAFGNKEALFRKVVDRYVERSARVLCARGPWPSRPGGVVERLLFGAIDLMTDPGHPRGCLMVQGGAARAERRPVPSARS